MQLNVIMQGHALDRLRELPDNSIDLVATSPPYYALRAYGTDPVVWDGAPDCEHEWVANGGTGKGTGGKTKKQMTNTGSFHDGKAGSTCSKCGAWLGELGSEPSPELFVHHLVAIFEEVRRVLKPTGTCFINIADTYASSGGHAGQGPNSQRQGRANIDAQNAVTGHRPCAGRGDSGIKVKDMCLVPERLLIALQQAGWWVRNKPIWVKGREYDDDSWGLNPMPGSQKDRCTDAYEMCYQLNKRGGGYLFDWMAIAETPRPGTVARISQAVEEQHGSERANAGGKSNGTMKAVIGGARFGYDKGGSHGAEARMKSGNEYVVDDPATAKVMPRNVWPITSSGTSIPHYATMPVELAERMVKVGSSEYGCCSKCRKPWERVIEKGEYVPTSAWSEKGAVRYDNGEDAYVDGGLGSGSTLKHAAIRETAGWAPTCKCEADVQRSIVLDPFAGAGTTLLAAMNLGRDYIGIELSPKYIGMAQNRLYGEMFAPQGD